MEGAKKRSAASALSIPRARSRSAIVFVQSGLFRNADSEEISSASTRTRSGSDCLKFQRTSFQCLCCGMHIGYCGLRLVIGAAGTVNSNTPEVFRDFHQALIVVVPFG